MVAMVVRRGQVHHRRLGDRVYGFMFQGSVLRGREHWFQFSRILGRIEA